MVRREQYRKTHEWPPAQIRERFLIFDTCWQLILCRLEFTISSPLVRGMKHTIPAALQRCSLPPQDAGRGWILIFYFIASKEEFPSPQYPLRENFGTHKVGTCLVCCCCQCWFWVCLVVGFFLNASCLWGKEKHIFLQNPFGSGVSVRSPVPLTPFPKNMPFCLNNVRWEDGSAAARPSQICNLK